MTTEYALNPHCTNWELSTYLKTLNVDINVASRVRGLWSPAADHLPLDRLTLRMKL